MNRARPKRKILLVLTCAVALLALAPVAGAVGTDEMPTETQPAAVATVPAEVDGETTDALYAQVVTGLPFSNFDFLALIIVLVGLTSLSFAVHRLNRDPRKSLPALPVTTDAE